MFHKAIDSAKLTRSHSSYIRRKMQNATNQLIAIVVQESQRS